MGSRPTSISLYAADESGEGMIPPAEIMIVYPNHIIRSRGKKFHAIPCGSLRPHNSNKLCSCGPVPIGEVDESGHGLWLHLDKEEYRP